jgi:hypothetical protein
MKIKTAKTNMVVIELNNGNEIMFSYNRPIAYKKEETIYLDEVYWNHSKTTARHRNKFLNMTTYKIKEALKERRMFFDDLAKLVEEM